MADNYGMKVWLELQVKNLKKVEDQVKQSLNTVDMEAVFQKMHNASNQMKSAFSKLNIEGLIKALTQSRGAKSTLEGMNVEGGIINSLKKQIQLTQELANSAKSIPQLTELLKKKNQLEGQLKEAQGLGQNIPGFSKVAKTIGAMLGILWVIKKVGQRMLNEMIKSSPYLQGILSVMGRAWSNMWRPFGDFLANLLRPLAVNLMKLSVKWLQFTRTPEGETAVKGASGMVAGGMAGAAIGGAVGMIGGPVGALAGAASGALIGASIGGIIALWDKMYQGVKNIYTVAFGWFDKFLEVFTGINMDAVREKIAVFINAIKGFSFENMMENLNTFFTVKIPEFFTKTIPDMITASIDKMGDFGGWIWEKLTSIWVWTKDVGNWLWSKIVQIWVWTKDVGAWLWSKIVQIWTWSKDLGTWLYNKITGSLSNIGTKLSTIGSYLYTQVTKSIKSAFENFKFAWNWSWSQDEGHQRGSSFIPSDGMYKLHKGEKVLNSSRADRESAAMGIIFSPSFTINSSGHSLSEIESTIKNSSRALEFEVRRRNFI